MPTFVDYFKDITYTWEEDHTLENFDIQQQLTNTQLIFWGLGVVSSHNFNCKYFFFLKPLHNIRVST